MKIQCDVCEKGEAAVFCTADDAALCELCDHRVHHANKLASKHQRFSLIHPSAKEAPLCDICKERRGFLFCQQDRAILCRECDDPIHSANELTQKHDRFLLSGIKVSATCSLYEGSNDASATRCTPSVRKNAPPTINSVQILNDGGGGGSMSSISEYLMETLPGWHFEDFLDSSSLSFGFSQSDENGLMFMEEGFDGFPWVPQGISPAYSSETVNGSKETKEFGVNMKNNRSVWRDDGFTVPQMSPPSSGMKRCRNFW